MNTLHNFTNDGEDDGFFGQAAMDTPNRRLVDLFNQSDLNLEKDTNSSLVFVAPKQSQARPNKTSATSSMSDSASSCPALTVLHSAIGDVFKYNHLNSPEHQGKLFVALCGMPDKSYFKFVVYKSNTQAICEKVIGPDFRFVVQREHYIYFTDESGCNWSANLGTSELTIEMAHKVAIAMARSCGGLLAEPLQMELAQGAGDYVLGEGVFATFKFKYYLLDHPFDTKDVKVHSIVIKLRNNFLGNAVKGMRQGGIRLYISGPLKVCPEKHKSFNEFVLNQPFVLEIAVEKCMLNRDQRKAENGSSSASSRSNSEENVSATGKVPASRADGVRSRASSLSDQFKQGPPAAKADLISRMAKMGQPLLPPSAPVSQPSSETEDLDVTVVDLTVSPPGRPEVAPKARPASSLSNSPFVPPVADFDIHQTSTPLNALAAQQTPSNLNFFHPNAVAGPFFHPGQMSAVGNAMPSMFMPPQSYSMEVANQAMALAQTRVQHQDLIRIIANLEAKIDGMGGTLNKLERSSVENTRIILPNGRLIDSADLVTSVMHICQENEGLKNATDDQLEKLGGHNAKISQLLHTNHKLMEEKNDIMERFNTLLSESTGAHRKENSFIQRLQTENNELRAEIDKMRGEVKVLRDDIAAKDQANRDLQEKQASLEMVAVTETQNLESQRNSAADTLMADLAGAQSMIAELTSEIASIELAEGTKSVEKASERSEMETRLAEENRRLKSELERLETRSVVADLKHKRLEAAYDLMRTDVGMEKAKVQQLEDESRFLTDQCAALRRIRESPIAVGSPIAGDRAELVAQVKRIMNKVYKRLQSEFDAGESYGGGDAIGLIASTIKETTLELVGNQEAMAEKSIDESPIPRLNLNRSDTPVLVQDTAGIVQDAPTSVQNNPALIPATSDQDTYPSVSDVAALVVDIPPLVQDTITVVADVPLSVQGDPTVVSDSPGLVHDTASVVQDILTLVAGKEPEFIPRPSKAVEPATLKVRVLEDYNDNLLCVNESEFTKSVESNASSSQSDSWAPDPPPPPEFSDSEEPETGSGLWGKL